MDSMEAMRQGLMTLNLDWARAQIPVPLDDFTLLVSIHKARYECPELPDSYRHESAEWLRERGFKGMHGLDLLPPGQLPL